MRGWLLLALMGHAVAASAIGGVYKWQDDRGVLHYDDRSQLGEHMTRASVARRQVTAESYTPAPPELVSEVKQRCRAASDRADEYAKASQLYGRDSRGKPYPLSRAETVLMRAETERERDYYCRNDAAWLIMAERSAEPAATKKPGG